MHSGLSPPSFATVSHPEATSDVTLLGRASNTSRHTPVVKILQASRQTDLAEGESEEGSQ